ncbi:4Fe-4S dicluster domain-containing protein [Selenomonas sp. KH1T6]|uniref:4Fe-4S dicluster domain-containing protein n=1 Tax=Selenomonas sp. KH1T6 TaxID=3158784 RepID=UPI0008A77F17|nr:S-layer homology domain-containing protein [Selenomonas ruminantium]
MFVMEPVKGGSLQRLPPDAGEVFDKLNQKHGTSHSYASYALRFVAGFEGIEVILSGMNAMEQMQENVQFMKTIAPLSSEEQEAIQQVREIFNSKQMIQCTACRYCTDECPKHILIPDMFACFNQKKIFNHWNQAYYYNNVLTVNNPKASDCLRCGKCEAACPQHLPIRDLLVEVANEFEPHIADMKPGEKGYQEALWAVSNRICFLGKGNIFKPEGYVRKLDVAVYLWRLAGRPAYEGKAYAVKDIPPDFKFREAVQWGLGKGLFFLDKEGKFHPGKNCKRLDAIVYLWRWSGRPEVEETELEASDYKDGAFVKAVLWAMEKKIVLLDKEQRLQPQELIDRRMTVQFMHKVNQNKG